MPGIFFIAVMLVVGLLLFWGTNHLFRNQLPTARTNALAARQV